MAPTTAVTRCSINEHRKFGIVLYLLYLVSIKECVAAEGKVQLALYYESCCPDSQYFITTSLSAAWNTDGFRDIVDIAVVPWGHGRILEPSLSDSDQPTMWCQHGSNECLAQRITACVDTLGSSEQTVDFVIHLATAMFGTCDDPTAMAAEIAQSLGMDWQVIAECVESTGGSADTMTMQYYQSTMALDPALDWVPWVTVNQQHSTEIQAVCEHSTLECVADVQDGTRTLIVEQPQREFMLNWMKGAMQRVAHTQISTLIVLSLLFTLFMVSGMLQFYRWWRARNRNGEYIKL